VTLNSGGAQVQDDGGDGEKTRSTPEVDRPLWRTEFRT